MTGRRGRKGQEKRPAESWKRAQRHARRGRYPGTPDGRVMETAEIVGAGLRRLDPQAAARFADQVITAMKTVITQMEEEITTATDEESKR